MLNCDWLASLKTAEARAEQTGTHESQLKEVQEKNNALATQVPVVELADTPHPTHTIGCV